MAEESEDYPRFSRDNNHTLRLFPYFHAQQQATITRITSRNSSSRDVTEYPLTEIDDYFDDGFKWAVFGTRHTSRSLNTKAQWEEVEDKLRTLAVKIEKRFNRYEDGFTTRFHVPATGHWIVPNVSIKTTVEDNWLFWKGKYYDPDFVYTLHHGAGNATPTELVPFCPLRFARYHETSNGDNGSMKDGWKLLTCNYFVESKDKRENSYLTIDLGGVCHISRLSTTGAYPSKLSTFPQSHINRRMKMHDRRRLRSAHRHLRRRQVFVVEDASELGWVTRYEVQYRNSKGKWQPYSSTLDGNVDCCTERVHDVDITARFLRIIPRDCHVMKAMTVRVFGNSVHSTTTEKLHVPVEAQDSEEVVVYELKDPQVSKYKAIDTSVYHKFRGKEKEKEKKERKTEFRRDIRYRVESEV